MRRGAQMKYAAEAACGPGGQTEESSLPDCRTFIPNSLS